MRRPGEEIKIRAQPGLPTVTSASATTSKTTAGSSASARALFLSFIHLDGLAVKAGSISFGDRRFSILILRKSHEPESPGTSVIAVGDDFGFRDFSMDRKRLAQAIIRGVPAQPPYK
jgi:hypothetical protein